MTRKQSFEYIIDILSNTEIEYEFDEENISINDLIAFCKKELDKLNTVKKANTKKQEETESIAMDIYDTMENETEYTISDIIEMKQELVGTSTSQMSAYMNVLYKMGMVTKGKKDKKVSYTKVSDKTND